MHKLPNTGDHSIISVQAIAFKIYDINFLLGGNFTAERLILFIKD